MPKQTFMTLRIDKKILDSIKAEATRDNRTVSAFVRLVLQDYLKRSGGKEIPYSKSRR